MPGPRGPSGVTSTQSPARARRIMDFSAAAPPLPPLPSLAVEPRIVRPPRAWAVREMNPPSRDWEISTAMGGQRLRSSEMRI